MKVLEPTRTERRFPTDRNTHPTSPRPFHRKEKESQGREFIDNVCITGIKRRSALDGQNAHRPSLICPFRNFSVTISV